MIKVSRFAATALLVLGSHDAAAFAASPAAPTLTDVVNRLKGEIRYFEIYDDLKASYYESKRSTSATGRSPTDCPYIAHLRISDVKIEINTKTDTSNDATGSAKVPIGSIELGPAGQVGQDMTGTQTLDLEMKPSADPPVPTATDLRDVVGDDLYQSYPLFASLKQTRDALEQIAHTNGKPCLDLQTTLTSGSGGSAGGSSLAYGFQVEDQKQGSFSFSILIFALGASHEATQTRGNTITVSFAATTTLQPPTSPK
jgi:hypothetical protein